MLRSTKPMTPKSAEVGDHLVGIGAANDPTQRNQFRGVVGELVARDVEDDSRCGGCLVLGRPFESLTRFGEDLLGVTTYDANIAVANRATLCD
jgi:hypothetical protein